MNTDQKILEKEESFRLREQRIEKLAKLEEVFSIDPYMLNLQGLGKEISLERWTEFKKKRKLSSQFKSEFENLENGACSENELIWVAGRIHSMRNDGMFIDMFDAEGKIQAVTEKELLDNSSDYEKDSVHFLDLLDKGDLIAVKGFAYRTPRGELSVKSKEIWILSKAIQPPPEIIEGKRRRLGLTDTEIRYRQRYLDLMVNPEVKEVFKTRALTMRKMRNFLDDKGFLEFETPVLQVEAGGATARPFVTKHNALDMELYLRIATELHLKRLLVGGFEKIYEIGRIFRNEGISTRHNPEFTSIEIYQAFADYYEMMDLTEELIKHLCSDINSESFSLDLSKPWRRAKMSQIVKEVTGKDFSECSLEQAKSFAKELKIEDPESFSSVGEIMTEVFERKCEETLLEPTFVLGHAWENSPLSGSSPDKDLLNVSEYRENLSNKLKEAQRFELYIQGKEVANGFTEQNDPRRQKRAFLEQQRKKAEGDPEAHPLDEDFIKALEFAMPPSGGVGIGIDRLIMFLTSSPSIRDVILFPTMKPTQHTHQG